MDHSRVIVLNSDYSFLTTIDWKRAINLIVMEKVEVIKSTSQIVRGIRTNILIPSVIRLIKFIRKIFVNKVPFNRNNVFYRDQYICQYCGNKFSSENLTIDHVYPLCRNGKTNFENCVASCKSCNNKKGGRTPREAGMGLKRKPFQPTIMEFISIKIKLLGIDKLIDEIWEY